jgi:hypothetical protein
MIESDFSGVPAVRTFLNKIIAARKVFWSAYLAIKGKGNKAFQRFSGEHANYEYLEITQVLKRYIEKYKDNFLSITTKVLGNNLERPFPVEGDIMHKKYLKYKHKYITLKNKMML